MILVTMTDFLHSAHTSENLPCDRNNCTCWTRLVQRPMCANSPGDPARQGQRPPDTAIIVLLATRTLRLRGGPWLRELGGNACPTSSWAGRVGHSPKHAKGPVGTDGKSWEPDVLLTLEDRNRGVVFSRNKPQITSYLLGFLQHPTT